MIADEDFECSICQCVTFEDEEMEIYQGYYICIMCAIALGM
jgi:hypothetical protein